MYLQKTQRAQQRKQWTFLSKHLRSLIEQGRFQKFTTEKKAQLISKLKSLFQKMTRFEKVSRLKKALGVAALLLGLQTTPMLQAQVDFATPVTNPFGLTSNSNFIFETLVDIDGDGDLDIIAVDYDGYSDGQLLKFYENESENGGTVPNFLAPILNYQGIALTIEDTRFVNPVLGDIDNDGDLDLLIGAYSYLYSSDSYLSKIAFFENIGDVNNPQFAAQVDSPFNIDFGNLNETAIIDLTDIDGDGDLDLFNTFFSYDEVTNIAKTKIDFFENIGTPENPEFAAAQSGAFGLPADFDPYKIYEFADIDNDGDIDMITGSIDNDSYINSFSFVENIGDANNPQFTTPVINPFSLENTSGYFLWPHLGDLDNDGDIDILISTDYEEVTETYNWAFYENLLIVPVGTKDLSLVAKATVSPTISSGIVTLQLEAAEVQEYYQLTLISATGQLLRQWDVEGGTIINEKIDLTALPASNYFIQVRTPDGLLVKKVMKQ